MITLRRLASLARAGGPVTDAYAGALLHDVAGSLEELARAIPQWVASRWFYEDDPYGVELVTVPDYQLERLALEKRFRGDCDDAAVLVAALGVAGGLEARYRVLAFDAAGTLAHVYAQLRGPSSGVWHEADVTRPAGPLLPETAEMFVTV